MAKHVLVVVTNPTTPEQEDEFNHWYSEVHLADVLKVPGFVAAQRFKLVHDAETPLVGPYLALYEMETDDPKGVLEYLTQLSNDAKIEISAAMHPTNITASIYSPMGERLTAAV